MEKEETRMREGRDWRRQLLYTWRSWRGGGDNNLAYWVGGPRREKKKKIHLEPVDSAIRTPRSQNDNCRPQNLQPNSPPSWGYPGRSKANLKGGFTGPHFMTRMLGPGKSTPKMTATEAINGRISILGGEP
jgi:hypothetical protein